MTTQSCTYTCIEIPNLIGQLAGFFFTLQHFDSCLENMCISKYVLAVATILA